MPLPESGSSIRQPAAAGNGRLQAGHEGQAEVQEDGWAKLPWPPHPAHLQFGCSHRASAVISGPYRGRTGL
jgi:hypothetical protein